MNKFKVGDKVKFIRTGKFGVINYIDDDDYDEDGCSHIYYEVNYINTSDWYTANDIEEVKEIKEILTEEEKEYLSNVIKPFRDEVVFICKKPINNEKDEYINIGFNHDCILFPNFKAGKYYKNMEAEREYILEELGL